MKGGKGGVVKDELGAPALRSYVGFISFLHLPTGTKGAVESHYCVIITVG